MGYMLSHKNELVSLKTCRGVGVEKGEADHWFCLVMCLSRKLNGLHVSREIKTSNVK